MYRPLYLVPAKDQDPQIPALPEEIVERPIFTDEDEDEEEVDEDDDDDEDDEDEDEIESE